MNSPADVVSSGSVQDSPSDASSKQPSKGNSALVARREEILRKKKRIEKIHSFEAIKKKVYTLASFKKVEEARDAYNSLYMVYNELLAISNDKEKQDLRTELSSVYERVLDMLSTKKVKKGKVEEEALEKKPDSSRSIRKKIITTDLDVVIGMLEEKGKLNLSDVQLKFGLSRDLAEEWIQILADYGLVSIKYLPVGGVEISKVGS